MQISCLERVRSSLLVLKGPSAPFQSAMKMTGSQVCSAVVRIYDNSLTNYLLVFKFTPSGELSSQCWACQGLVNGINMLTKALLWLLKQLVLMFSIIVVNRKCHSEVNKNRDPFPLKENLWGLYRRPIFFLLTLLCVL